MPAFEHSWNPDEIEENVSDNRPPEGVVIKMSIDAGEGFWLSANRAGFDYLARLFAEISRSELEPGWHMHRDENFDFSTGAPEFTFGVIDADEAPDA